MQESKRRKLTREQVEALTGFKISDTGEVITGLEEEEDPTISKRKQREGLLPKAGALISRLGSGIASGIVGAVPSFITTPAAAAIGGAGEALAQKIESPDPIDTSAVGVEAGLSAFPFGKVFKAGKPIISALRGAGLMEAGNMARRYNDRGELLPESAGEWAFDIGTSAVGGLGGMLPYREKGTLAEKIAEVTDEWLPNQFRRVPNRTDVMSRPTPVGEAQVDLAKIIRELPDELPPVSGQPQLVKKGGLLRPSDPRPIPTEAVMVPGGPPSKKGDIDDFWIFSDDPVENALAGIGRGQRIEEAVDLAPGVREEQRAIINRFDEEDLANLATSGRPAPGSLEGLKSVDRARELNRKVAEVQRKANEKTRKVEGKLLTAERNADLQDTRSQLGGPDIRKIEQQRAKAQQAANNEIVQKEKAHATANTMVESERRAQAAQDRIDEALADPAMKETPDVVTETTVKVPTASGNQTLRKSWVKKLEKEGGDEGDLPRRKVPQAPPPDPTVPQDPKLVARTEYPNKESAMAAAMSTGKRAVVQQTKKKGGWIVRFIDDKGPEATGAAGKTPDAPAGGPSTGGAAAKVDAPAQGKWDVDETGKPFHVVDKAQKAGVAFTITKGVRQQLYDLGYKRADVDAMPPQKAQDIIASGKTKNTPPPEAPPAAPAPVKPKPKGPAPAGGLRVGGGKKAEPKAEAPVAQKSTPRKATDPDTEMDLATREEVKNWTPNELKQGLTQRKNDPKWTQIIRDEIKRRASDKLDPDGPNFRGPGAPSPGHPPALRKAEEYKPGMKVKAYGSEGTVLTTGPTGVRVKFTSGRMVKEQGKNGYFDVDPNHIDNLPEGAAPLRPTQKSSTAGGKQEKSSYTAIPGLGRPPNHIFDDLQKGGSVTGGRAGSIVETQVQNAWDRGLIKSAQDVVKYAEMPMGSYQGMLERMGVKLESPAVRKVNTPTPKAADSSVVSASTKVKDAGGFADTATMRGAGADKAPRLKAEYEAKGYEVTVTKNPNGTVDIVARKPNTTVKAAPKPDAEGAKPAQTFKQGQPLETVDADTRYPDAKVVSLEGATNASQVKQRVTDAIKEAYGKAPEADKIVTSSGAARSGVVKVNGEEVAKIQVDYSREHGTIEWKDNRFKHLADTVSGDGGSDMADAVAQRVRNVLYQSDDTPKLTFRVGNTVIRVANNKAALKAAMTRISKGGDDAWDGLVSGVKRPSGKDIKDIPTPWDSAPTKAAKAPTVKVAAAESTGKVEDALKSTPKKNTTFFEELPEHRVQKELSDLQARGVTDIEVIPNGKTGRANVFKIVGTEYNRTTAKVGVDLTGATTAKDVKDAVLSVMNRYAHFVKKEAEKVDAWVVAGNDKPLPNHLASVPIGKLQLEVPNGPTITVGPEQVFELMEEFQKKGDSIWDGIVTKTKRPTSVTIPITHGSNFGSKGVTLTSEGGQEFEVATSAAPSVKINFADKTKTKPEPPTTQAKGGAAPKTTKAAKQTTPSTKSEAPRKMVAPKAKPIEDPAKAAAAAKAAPSELNDLVVKEQEAWDKYWKLKEDFANGKATNEEVRAAGKAAGEIRAEVAKKAKELGEEAPTYARPQANLSKEKPAPAKRGRPRKTVAEMPPAEQEKTIDSTIKSVKKKGLNEKGQVVNELVMHLGLGAAGAAAGAASNPEDPITGAILGGITFGGGSAVARSVYKHLTDPALSNKARAESTRQLTAWNGEKIDNFFRAIPTYYRASLLSNLPNLAINAWVGPYGTMMMSAIEHTLAGDELGPRTMKLLMSPKFIQDYFKSWQEAGQLIRHSSERFEGVPENLGPQWFQTAVELPANILTAGDVAARKLLMEAGFTEAQARRITLTSEPISPWGASVGNARKSKGLLNDKQSWIVQMALPFYRTNVNQLEQGILRLPMIGPLARRKWNDTPIPLRQELVQQAITLGAGAGAYMLGALTPERYERGMLKIVNNFGGQYGTVASLAFIAGAAKGKGKELPDQVGDAARRFIRQDMPAVSFEQAWDIYNIGMGLMKGEAPDKLPSGTIPSFMSSREKYSIPSLMRDPEGLLRETTPGMDSKFAVTEKEYSLFAPFVDRPKLREKTKKLTKGQLRVKRYNEKLKKIRERIREGS